MTLFISYPWSHIFLNHHDLFPVIQENTFLLIQKNHDVQHSSPRHSNYEKDKHIHLIINSIVLTTITHKLTKLIFNQWRVLRTISILNILVTVVSADQAFFVFCLIHFQDSNTVYNFINYLFFSVNKLFVISY